MGVIELISIGVTIPHIVRIGSYTWGAPNTRKLDETYVEVAKADSSHP